MGISEPCSTSAVGNSPVSSSASEASDIFDLKDDENWEDAEPEDDQEQIISLLDDQVFPDAVSMLRYCKEIYQFDFLAIRDEFCLDFYGLIRLVNYVRSQVKSGHSISLTLSETDFEDERYLKPVLQDDALLFNLDELPHTAAISRSFPDGEGEGSAKVLARVAELEEELLNTQTQFASYREQVARTIEDRWTENTTGIGAADKIETIEKRDDDTHYFNSYSFNDIHETMLKDTVRTEAYRDFIYDNKHIFAGKVVLDVGCGTGILSLFCAKAGASLVIAVDNSAIIDKARENVYNNGFSSTITCLRGKVEEVRLPVDKVDIIVSEWMGYCLLYEAMLDSVIWARDNYLQFDGLMIPSHINMWMAPIEDPDYVSEHFAFWRDVYGFDMKAMQAGIHDDAHVLHMPVSALCAEPVPVLQLSLLNTTLKDLVFKKTWSVILSKDIDNLDGFLLWFDTFFMSTKDSKVPENAKAEQWSEAGNGTAFTTGPFGKETHWRQGVLFANSSENKSGIQKGQVLSGDLEYAIPIENSRALDLSLSWAVGSVAGNNSQVWKMR